MTYVPLRVRSNFSFLEGASHPHELVERAAALGLPALALTDRDGVHGVVRAHVASREAESRLLVGAEVTLAGRGTLALLAPDLQGYGDLCELITRGRGTAMNVAAPDSGPSEAGDAPEGATGAWTGKAPCAIQLPDLLASAGRLLAVTLPDTGHPAARTRLCRDGPGVPAEDDPSGPRGLPLGPLREAFGDRLYVGVARHLEADEEDHLREAASIARRLRLPLVAAHDVVMHSPERKPLQDVLTCIRLGTTLPRAGDRLLPNAERTLLPPAEMQRRYASLPGALERTLEVAARCSFSLDQVAYQYPSEVVPPGSTPMGHLRLLVAGGARRRYPEGVPPAVAAQLEHELSLIEQLDYPAYFLTMEEIVAFARARGILCQGRGSAANSAVCYVLGVTSVDPARGNCLFERFISAERNEPPDIDVDFEHERREEVIQHIYRKYGRDRAGMVAEVIRYRGRSAVRDVGKALDLPLDAVDRLARTLSHWGGMGEMQQGYLAEAGVDEDDPTVRLLISLCHQMNRFPRHLSIHVGGFVISDARLTRLVPVENASMDGRTVIQWDKDDVDDAGLLKIDLLSLGMLTALRKAFRLIEAHEGQAFELATVPAEDQDTYRMLRAADTIGTFQVESRAQMTLLPRLLPERYYDLVVEIALMRPGPIQGRMVHPYLRRRHGLEPITYPHPSLVPVLERTCGVPLFQEQVMRLAVVAAGFTPGEADQLRRAMAKWGMQGRIKALREKLLAGMLARGITQEFALRVLEQIEGFGDYGFPESHAASFAILAYASCWLKRHHTAAFVCALLNSQPMGFYAPHTLVQDAQAHGVVVLPVNVARSGWDCGLEPAPLQAVPRAIGESGGADSRTPLRAGDHNALGVSFTVHDQARLALRLGFRMIKGFREEVARRLVEERARRPFGGLEDLASRVRPPGESLMRLAAVGALDGLGGLADRRQAVWRVQGLPGMGADLLDGSLLPEPAVAFPPMSEVEVVEADYSVQGLSVDLHPVQPLRPALERSRVTSARDLKRLAHGKAVRVAGLVTVRQGPETAKGMVFVTLEDEFGMVNLVFTPQVFARFRPVVRGSAFLLAEGTVERNQAPGAGNVVHVKVRRVSAVRVRGTEVRAASRDFH
jgi:error-prone DNA polymerase